MRRYDDPVEVRRGDDAPEQFLWRGRLWKVRAVLARSVQTGSWRQPAEADVGLGVHGGAVAGVPGVPGDLLVERELWRVEAGRGGVDPGGVFDLSFDWSDGRWSLVGCAD